MKKYIFFFLFLFTCVAICAGQQEKTISLDVKDMDLTDVLRMIADQSGTNIIASKNVKGLVAINLQDVSVETALDAILKVNNCAYVREGDIIQVYTLAEYSQKDQFSKLYTKVFRLQHVKAADLKQAISSLKSTRGMVEIEAKSNTIIVTDTSENIRSVEEAIKELDKILETRVYKLSYAKPSDLQKTLQALIPATEGEMLIDERTNRLIVTATPMLLNKIDAIAKNWDKQIPQVLIEAKILQVTLGKSRNLGVEWQYQQPGSPHLNPGVLDFPIPTGSAYVEALKVGVLALDDYEATLRVLETSSDVDLISSPSIVALDGSEAKILIGSSEPYEVFHFDQFGNINSKEIKFVEVGIKLIVTPKISDDGFITMTIHPEVSSPREGTVTNSLAVDTTEANTVMTVKDGYTVVLGGLIKDDKQKNIAKIPLLGDIPILGFLFRSTYYTTTKKEIIIFITPRIVSPTRTTSIEELKKHTRREEEIQRSIDKLKNSRRRK